MNIIDLLKRKEYTISTAESLTAGLVSSNIASISGSSACLKCGIVSYTKEAKCKLLGLNMADIENYGVYSRQTALSMAKGVMALSGSNCAIATSGVAGPGPDEGVEQGTVYYAFVIGKEEYCEVKKFEGTRNEVRNQAAEYAVNRFCELLIDTDNTNFYI